MKPPKSLYSFRGLPVYYHGLGYEHTKLPAPKQEQIKAKIANAPVSGTLLVSGCAAPVANQLMDIRKVVGLSFVEYFESKISNEETMVLPQAQVVVVYDIGSEPAKSTEYSSKLLNSILATYKAGETLLIFETALSPVNFAQKYGVTVKNVVVLQLLEETTWI